MNERSESGAALVVAGILIFLLLLVTAGGSFTYFVHARQKAAAIAEARMAYQAATAANMQLEKARAREDLEKTVHPPAPSAPSPSEESSKANPGQLEIAKRIETMLQAQAAAWNAGDIDRFMEHYWKSEELTFSSGGKTTRGWSATLDRYRQRYPTPEEMGQLQFDNLEITPLSDGAALVLGEWHVKLSSASINGNFSLVVRNVNDRWLIVHDHTSRAE